MDYKELSSDKSMRDLIETLNKLNLGYSIVCDNIDDINSKYFTIEDKDGYQVTVELGSPPIWVQTIAYKNYLDKSGKRPGVVLNESRCQVDVFDHKSIIDVIKEAFYYARVF